MKINVSVVLMGSSLMELVVLVLQETIQEIVSALNAHRYVQSVKVQHIVLNVQVEII